MDFRNQNIVDILMVLADISGTSIIPDETVSGTASFHFTDSDFEESLGLFLSAYKLHYRREGNIIRVSRIDIDRDEERNLVSMRATDVEVENLIKALARAIGTTILYDPLPRMAISVDIERLSPAEVLEIMTLRLSGYKTEFRDNYFYIRRLPQEGPPGQVQNLAAEVITQNGGLFSMALEKGRFLEVVVELFRKSGKEFSILTKTDSVLENLYFTDRSFENLLRLVLEQGNADYVIFNDIFYIIELQRRDVMRKLRETEIIQLSHISAQDIPAFLPADLASGNVLKVDRNSNTVMLTGTAEEVQPVREFIARIDKPMHGMRYERFEFKYLNVTDSLSVIPQKFTPIAPVVVPHSNAFIVLGSEEGLGSLRDFIEMIDRKDEGYPIRLKYIRIEDLLKTLPPSISKEEITDSGYPNLVFFTGTEEKRELFMRELSVMDRPKPQIRYELLVIQYMKNNEIKTGRTLDVTKSDADSGRSFTGHLSNLLNLSFDVVAQFGYQFAASLSIQLGENTADVFADTTLNGLSGQEIQFQNTDTYRYQEFEVDEDTGNMIRAGVTREITSGLIVTLNGWVSGDDMITMSVNATVSKQNNNSGSSTTTIPSTSERVVNTQVRTPSGKPIVISGLIKDDVNTNIQKVPVLGSIPLIGRLFRDQVDTKEKTEIVLYIVPYLMRDEAEEQDVSVRLERYYRSFVSGYGK